MSTDALLLPDDLAACQALIQELAATIEEQAAKIGALEQEKQELNLIMNELLQRAFRRRSERYLEDPHQLKLDFPGSGDAAEGLAEAVEESRQPAEETVVAEHVRRRRVKRTSGEEFPAHLPREEVEAPVPDELKHCPTHGERKLIGFDTTQTLVFQRPKLKVVVTKYPKYVCEGEPQCGVASPERPTSLVEGNRYDTSVATEVIAAKYAYHMPTYRQQDDFASNGWTPSRSTLLNLLTASAFVIRPLIEYFSAEVIDSGRIGTDETRVTLLLPQTIPKVIEGDLHSQRAAEVFAQARAEDKPSVAGRMWVYRSLTTPLNVFDFTVSRHRDGPDLFLKNFQGTLLADCYSGYQGITLRTGGLIQRAACGAHARRKVFEARDAYPLEAGWLLAQFQQLYDIEDRAKPFSVEERVALRQLEAQPVWQRIQLWLDGPAAAALLPKSMLAQAVGYLRNHWDPLRLYLTDGLLPIDNNEVEQLMKQVALGRKNWLFIGSLDAGRRAADFLTLVSSAVRNDLDVWAYIKDVLDQLLAGQTDYRPLRPDVWREAHPEAVRDYRVQERRDRADRVRHRRADRRTAAR
jgi:transposase